MKSEKLIYIWPKCEKLGTLKIIVIFILFIAYYSKHYLADTAEHLVSVIRIHGGKNKKWLVKILTGCRDTAVEKSCSFCRQRANHAVPTVSPLTTDPTLGL